MTYRAKDLPAWVRFRAEPKQQPLPTLSEIVTTAIRNRSGALAEHLARNNALLARLKDEAAKAPHPPI